MNIRKRFIVTGILVSPLIITGCGGSSSSSPSNTGSPTGAYTLNTTGGIGGADGGTGGNGDDVDFYKEAGIGNVEMLNSSVADASFTAITPATNLGSNPLNIAADTTIAVEAVEPTAGTPYLIASNGILRISDGNGILSDETPVTGISVASGATLTLGLNYTSYARVNLDNDVSNSGTITTEDIDATDRGSLRIYPASYVGATGSTLNTAGTLDSQNGGDITISTDYSFYNRGPISTNGSDSAAGNAGSGGSVYLTADYTTQNTGNIDSSGGDAANGTAGNGDSIDIEADYGNMHNNGNLMSRGGNGQTGGDGNSIYLYANTGEMLNSGDIDNQGGTGSTGNGGNSDNVDMYAYGGKLVSSGDISSMGGSTTDLASNGGNGGDFYLYSRYGSLYQNTPAKDLFVSGNINTSGGDAIAAGTGDGGNGGYVQAQINSDNYPSEARIAFLGYTDIDTSGGAANFGGNAGDVNMYNDAVWSNADVYVPSGNVANEADVVSRGGNVVATATNTPANGGTGGDFYLQTDYDYGYINPDLEITTNEGDVDLSGGNSLESTTASTGRSGTVWLWGYNGVSNNGSIIANGGDDLGTDLGTTGYGNYANDIDMYAELGPISNSGNLTNNGGAGEYQGGRSDGVDLFGPTVSNSGDISSNGGNADASLAGSTGGYGGDIEFFSSDGVAGVTHSGSVSHTAGTGETVEDFGSFVRGGMCVSGDC